MNHLPHRRRIVKPAVCESAILRQPLSPCEMIPAGVPGVLVINATEYACEILGYLPEVGEPVIDGYRLTKTDGTAHDICLVRGRLECTCGDWIWRRAAQTTAELADCKHVIACKRHLQQPVEQMPAPVCQCNDFDDP